MKRLLQPQKLSKLPKELLDTVTKYSSQYKILIDIRERDIIREIEKVLPSICYEIKRLDVGDFQIINIETNDILITIERKTTKDLASSIIDGRNREQKMRMLGSGIISERIMYIIEGIFSVVENLPYTTLIGSIINTQLRDNIKVYRTLDIFETVEYIVILYNKLIKNSLENDDGKFWSFLQKEEQKEEQKEDSTLEIKYASNICKSQKKNTSLKLVKKDNITSKILYMSILLSIPRLSEKMIEPIMAKYPNLIDLINAYISIDNSQELSDSKKIKMKKELLVNLEYKTSNGLNKKIGPAMSLKIYELLYTSEM